METLGIEEEHMIGPAKCSYKPTTIIGPISQASNSQNFGAKVSNQNFPPKCKTSKIKEKRNREREREREKSRRQLCSSRFNAANAPQCRQNFAIYSIVYYLYLNINIISV